MRRDCGTGGRYLSFLHLVSYTELECFSRKHLDSLALAACVERTGVFARGSQPGHSGPARLSLSSDQDSRKGHHSAAGAWLVTESYGMGVDERCKGRERGVGGGGGR